MQVKFTYSQIQLNAVVEFIGKNNSSFLNQFDHIRRNIISNMHELANKFPDCYFIGTMGYLISGDVLSEEDMDSDNNIVMFDITVDPSVSQDKWSDDDVRYEIITVLKEDAKSI